MFRTAHPSHRLAVALALLLPWPALAAPPPRSYLFVPVVDSTSLGATPYGGALNDRGQIVFPARLPTGDSALFLWDGGEIRLLARTEVSGSFLFPDLNNRGEVVTAISHFFQELVFVRLRGGEVVERIEGGGPLFDVLLCCPFLNERGDMTLFGVLAGGPGGIFTLNRGRLTTIAEEGGAFTFLGPVGGINNRGQVAFTGDPDDLDRAAVVLGDGHRLTVVADASGPYEFFTDPVVNDRAEEGEGAALLGDRGEPAAVEREDPSGAPGEHPESGHVAAFVQEGTAEQDVEQGTAPLDPLHDLAPPQAHEDQLWRCARSRSPPRRVAEVREEEGPAPSVRASRGAHWKTEEQGRVPRREAPGKTRCRRSLSAPPYGVAPREVLSTTRDEEVGGECSQRGPAGPANARRCEG